MNRQLRTELLKLRTTRTTKGVAIAGVVLAGLLGAATAAIAGNDGAPELGSPTWVADVLGVSSIPVAISVLLGVLLSAGEYQHGTITNTFLVTPRRTRVIMAKAAAMAVTGAIVAVTMAACSALGAAPMLIARGVSPEVVDHRVALSTVGVLVACSLLGALGALLGMLVRSQVAAVVIVIGWALLLEGILDTILGGGLSSWLPGGAAADLIGHGPRSHLLAALLLAAWTSAIGLLAIADVRRRDVP